MTEQPQSIVHQAIRLTQKSSKLLSRLRSRNRGKRRKKETSSICPSQATSCTTNNTCKDTPGTMIGAHIHVNVPPSTSSHRQLEEVVIENMVDSSTSFGYLFAELESAKEALTNRDDESSTSISTKSSSSSSSLSSSASSLSLRTSTSPPYSQMISRSLLSSSRSTFHGDYRTINQNDLFLECFETNDIYSIIHFYEMEGNEQSNVSKMVDRHLEELAMKHTGIKFLRIRGTSAPFFTAKLKLKTFPCIVALRDGDVVNRLVDFERFGLFSSTNDEWDETFLNQWIVAATRTTGHC